MEMTTLAFLGFFALAAALYWLLPRVVRPYLLLVLSYAFYCYTPENRSLIGILLSVTLLTWLCGIGISAASRPAVRRILTALAAAGCLGTLFLFKYYDFFGGLLTDLSHGRILPAVLSLTAPLGLSYFSFQALGYVCDLYEGRCKPVRNPLHYALFVSFFPCILTGPIEQTSQLLPQLVRPPRFSYDTVAGGAFRMLWGYFKKMVLADTLAAYVRAYYAGAVVPSGPALAAAAALFSLQLYFDFSGCCDIVIGGARLFGIHLAENFENPFLSTSYAELWRRWHKSLLFWFRRHLYIPLGGSRCPTWRWALNLMAVFLFSGLWHGAAIGYLQWGLLCGLLVLAERLPARLRARVPVSAPAARHAAVRTPAAVGAAAVMQSAPAVSAALPAEALPDRNSSAVAPMPFPIRWLRRAVVFCEFSLCFVLFASSLYGGRANPYAPLFSAWNRVSFLRLRTALTACGIAGNTAWMLLIGSLLVFSVESRGDVAEWIRRRIFLLRWLLYAALAFAILFFGVFGQSAFIYQQY